MGLPSSSRLEREIVCRLRVSHCFRRCSIHDDLPAIIEFSSVIERRKGAEICKAKGKSLIEQVMEALLETSTDIGVVRESNCELSFDGDKKCLSVSMSLGMIV